MTDQEQPQQPSVSELMNERLRQNERLRRNLQNVAYCTAVLPEKEKLLKEAMKSQAYYNELVPRLGNEINILRKRYEFSIKFCADNQDENAKMVEANKIAAKIKKLERELLALREEEASKAKNNLNPDVGM